MERNKLYLPELDGLRAFAVFIVIVNHFNKTLMPSGFIGVDIFFLISGYVITSSLSNRSDKNFWEFISGFYFRRVKRIFPALIICVLFTSIAICLFNDSPQYELKTAFTSLFGFSNFYLIKISTNYFSQSAEINPFMHTWSLGVEEQFYFLFPLVVWYSGFGRNNKFSEKKLFITISFLSLFSLISFISLYQDNQTFTYFFMPARFWEIASGCLLFLAVQKKFKFIRFFQSIPVSIIFISICLITLLPLKYFLFSVISTILLTSILIMSLKKQSFLYEIFTNKKVVFFGLISYSLYLWHWPVISISKITLGIHWWSVPFQSFLIFSFAILSYFFIEKPIRNNMFSNNNKVLFFIFSGSSLLIASIGIIFLNQSPQIIYLGNKELLKFSTVFKIKINNTEINDKECDYLLVFNNERPQCTVKPKNKDGPTIYLFGDSHMQHYLPLFEKLSEEGGYGYKFFGRPGMPIGSRKMRGLNGYVKDDDLKFVIDETIKKLSKNDIFIISERNERNFAPKMLDGDENFPIFYEKEKQISRDKALLRYSEYLKLLFEKINSKNAHLIVFQPTHSFNGTTIPPNICRQWFTSLNPSCEKGLTVGRNEVLTNLKKIREMHLRISKETKNGIKIFDPFPILCPVNKVECTQILNKNPLFMDNDHLSEEGALLIKDEFDKFLNQISNSRS